MNYLALTIQHHSHALKSDRFYCKIPQGQQFTTMKSMIIVWRNNHLRSELANFLSGFPFAVLEVVKCVHLRVWKKRVET